MAIIVLKNTLTIDQHLCKPGEVIWNPTSVTSTDQNNADSIFVFIGGKEEWFKSDKI